MSDVSDDGTGTEVGETATVVALVQGGTEREFSRLVERHRRELRVHCYRMLGSFDDAEDLVQETLAKAWRSRAGFEGRSTFRAWLYRIATNSCLDEIKRKRRRVREVALPPGADPSPTLDEVPWLQPFPDRLLDVEDGGDEPDAVAVSRETVELAFLAAVQHLPPRPRAVLILRDVLGWSARETADVLDGTVASVNSALQRARARMQELGRPGRLAFSPIVEPSAAERDLVQRYMDAHERADADAVIALLGEDVRFSMPPQEERYEGRAAVAGFIRGLFGDESPGEWRMVATRANGLPAVANYIRAWGEDEFRPVVLDLLRFEDGVVVEITSFTSDTFATFGLPATWPPA